MAASGRYPPPRDRAEWENLLASPRSEDRLRAAMTSFELGEPGIDRLLAGRLISEGNNLVKATLVKAVGRFKDVGHLELLSGYLTDPDDRVRANTVEALGFYDDPRVLKLVNPMISDGSSRVRGNALLVLGRFDQARTMKVIDGLAGSDEGWRRETAIYVLGRVGGRYAATRLAAMLRRETAPNLERAIYQRLNQLAKAGVPEAVEAIRAATVERVETGTAPRVDPAQAGKVEGLEVPEGDARFPVASPPAPQVATQYPGDLASPEPRRRLEAVQLAPDGDAEAFQRLSQMLAGEQDDYVLATLVKKLPRLDPAGSRPLLLPFLGHADGRVRANTVEGLGSTELPEVVTDLEPMLEDPHPRVRAQAARVLANLRKEQGKAVAILKEMLLEGDEAGALAALHALEAIDGGIILEILELALVHPRPRIRSRILHALEAMGERNPLAARLAERYSTSDTFEDAEHVNRLLARMNSKDEEVRYESLRRLALVQNEKARSRIELATSDASERVRNLAVALVEDFGRAYKRQGVLHSVGLRAMTLMRQGKLEVLGGDALVTELQDMTAQLEAAEDASAAAAQLLARRRETLVALGELVHRQAPGAEDEQLASLLTQVRALEPEAPAAAPVVDDGPPAGPDLSAELDKAMRDVADEEAGGGRKRRTTRQQAAAGPAGGGGKFEFPTRVVGVVVAMLAMGGVSWWAASGLTSNLLDVDTAWSVPVDSACHVAAADTWVYALSKGGELLCAAAPTGNVKWRRKAPDAREGVLAAAGIQLLHMSGDDGVVARQGPKDQEQWETSLGGDVTPELRVVGEDLALAVEDAPGRWFLRIVERDAGTVRWEVESSTGRPGGVARHGDGMAYVAGATLFALDAASGSERWSYDHEEDFILPGPVALDSSGTVLACGTSKVVAVAAGGVVRARSGALGSKPLRNPWRRRDGKLVVLSSRELVVLAADLTEVSRVSLPITVTRWADGGDSLFVVGSGAEVVRVRLDGGAVEVIGTVRASTPVVSVTAVGGVPVVGTITGIELIPLKEFG